MEIDESPIPEFRVSTSVPLGELEMDYDDSGEDPDNRPFLALLEAVLARAVLDILRPAGYKFNSSESRDAALWVYTVEELFPFSFPWICQGLKLDRMAVRRTVWLQLEDIANGTNTDPRIPSKLHEFRTLIERCSICPVSRFTKKANETCPSPTSLVRAYKR